MKVEIITKEDLESVKNEILKEIRLITKPKDKGPKREWLKSYEVLEMLNMSKGKLHSLRISGKLAYTRIGHCIYYKYDDVMQLMESNKRQNPPLSRARFS